MTPKQLEKRCSKIFGKTRWRGDLALNLGWTRQNVDYIMAGRHGIKQPTITLIEAWEAGSLVPKRRALGHAGRPFKKRGGK